MTTFVVKTASGAQRLGSSSASSPCMSLMGASGEQTREPLLPRQVVWAGLRWWAALGVLSSYTSTERVDRVGDREAERGDDPTSFPPCSNAWHHRVREHGVRIAPAANARTTATVSREPWNRPYPARRRAPRQERSRSTSTGFATSSSCRWPARSSTRSTRAGWR